MKKLQKIQTIAAFIFQKTYKWIILFICILAFIGILRNVFEQESLQMDQTVYEYVVLHLRQEPLTIVMMLFTNLGEPYFLMMVVLLSFICAKDKKVGIWITINLVISVGLNLLLKNVIQRPRPEGYRLIQEHGYSFPSGHSMVSVAFYGFIAYLVWKKVENKRAKYILCAIFSILPVLIGFSRIYLGVHYASDVLAGFLLSISYLIIWTTIIKSYIQKS